VGVHETGHNSTGLYYRVGHLRNSAVGDYTIYWDSGTHGIQYDNGINPHIAINNFNDVVEVHQVPNEYLLHYRRGKIDAGQIVFGPSKRYDNDGREPAVALLDDGLIIEVHVSGTYLHSRIGTLNPSKLDEIIWQQGVRIYTDKAPEYPAVAAAGTYAVQSHDQPDPWVFMEQIHYSVADLGYSNGTVLKGSGDKVYVVLNNYRFWIPNHVTFDAMGYDWGKIQLLSDDRLHAIPEGNPFPSVAR
jgi:hypothetical protein